jgi:hypothetical protein
LRRWRSSARMSCSVRRRRSGTLDKSGRHGDRARKDSDQSRSKSANKCAREHSAVRWVHEKKSSLVDE